MRWWGFKYGDSCAVIIGTALAGGILVGGCASGDLATGLSPGDAGSVTGNDATDAAGSSSEDATLGSDASSDPPDAGDESDAGGGVTTDAAPGAHDSGGPDSSTPRDAGQSVDSGAVLDAGIDATADSGVDAGVDAGIGPDGGLPVSITNPIQIDVSALLTIDTVGASAPQGIVPVPAGTLTSMDGSGYDFYTATVATANGVSGGLPPNGIFYANGTRPEVDLHFSDTSTSPNSLQLNAAAPNNAKTFSFAVPALAYTQVQIYGTSAEGTSSLTFTLTYSDATTSSSSVTIPDWGTNAASGSVFVLAGSLGRVGSQVFEGHNGFALYGANLGPDTTKALASVTVTTSGSGRFVFYGATAW